MSEQEREGSPPGGATSAGGPSPTAGTSRTRRRLAAGGLVGTGVLMTMSSRSALGQVVGGCGSETASAALSRHGEVQECGCSPGFWWNPNGQKVWSDHLEIYFPKTASFNTVFCSNLPLDVKPFFVDDGVTLLQARKDGGPYPDTNYKGGNIPAVGMHAVAALLNTQFYGDRYPALPPFASANDVILAFQEALQLKDGLEAFKARVDVYDGLWCFNGTNWGD